jgi:hypothetical protein
MMMLALCLSSVPPVVAADLADPVEVLRVPAGGIQPQIAFGPDGALHLLYFRGDSHAGDLYYMRRPPGQTAFADTVQVNSTPGSIIAVGTVRGGHMALGKNGRVHVAWMSADRDAPGMMYTRMADDGTHFEPQRNVALTHTHLDGGGSIAADDSGGVYVAWHSGNSGEELRRIWMARSTDDGKTFRAEERSNPIETGACGCCGMRAGSDSGGNIYMMYRAARASVHRDMTLLVSGDGGESFRSTTVGPWDLAACPMSTTQISASESGVLIAWETDGQIYWSRLAPESPDLSDPAFPPAEETKRKHPAIAGGTDGQTLLAWTEGTGWKRGGSLGWQIFDSEDRPTSERGRIDGAIPVWGSAAGMCVLCACVTLELGRAPGRERV